MTMISVTMWMDVDSLKLYVKLNERINNRDFHEKFLRPMKVLGFRFDPSRVAHTIDMTCPQEFALLARQLESNFDVSALEKKEIMYWLGLKDISGAGGSVDIASKGHMGMVEN